VVMRLHHILYDRWSLPVLRKEIDLLYTSFCRGEDSPLAELPLQVGDFAVWQRRYLEPDSPAFRTQLAYWKEQLSGDLPILRLPCERSSELNTASVHDAQAPFEIAEELSRDLRSLTKREGTTLFITFLTALKALINLSTGQNDIMLGTYMAKRSAPECEGMMGCFSDLGVLRTWVSSDLSFMELLGRVRETVLNAQSHEDMPFEMLNDELRRCGQAAPDVRAIFTFETFSERPMRLANLRVSSLSIAAPVMPWRFQMRVREGRGKFSGLARFDTRLHYPHLVRIMMRNYVRLLNAVVANPATRLCDVEDELGGW
jgi:Condensation domain